MTITPPGKFASFETTITMIPGEESGATYTLEALPENIGGAVRERGTRRALAAIKVELLSFANEAKVAQVIRTTYTDGEGRFGFRGVPAGDYDVRLSGDGYLGASFEETIKASQVLKALYYLEAKFYDKYTARTTTKATSREVTKRTITLEEVRRIPGTLGDPVRVIQNLPGVARPRFLGGQIIVRGAAPQDTRLFLSGDEVPNVFHFLAGPAVINAEMLESINFYPGNFSVEYGRATAGIINLKARSPKTDGLHGFAKVDLIDSALLIEGPINEDWSFAVSGRRSYVDVLLNAVFSDELQGATVLPRYYDYQGWLTYKGLKDHLFELRLYGSDDKLTLLAEDSEDEDDGFGFADRFLRGSFRWVYKPKGPISNEMMVSIGRNNTRVDAGPFLFDSGKNQSLIRNTTTLALDERVALRVGLDFQFARTDVDIIIPQSNRQRTNTPPSDNDTGGEAYGGDLSFLSSLEDQAVLQPAFFVDALIKPFDGTEIVPGVRMDYYGSIARASVSPRLTARQKVAERLTIKGGVGLFTQQPQLIYTNPLFGNPDLKPERAIHYSVGMEWALREYFSVDTTLFYRDMRDLVVTDPKLELGPDRDPDNPNVILYQNTGKGRSYGLELLVKHDLSERFFGWIAYTLSRSERQDLVTKSFDIYENDQTHILTLVGGYKLPYGFDVSARFRLVSGFPNTPVIGSVYDVDRNRYEPVFAETNSGRETAFHQLDLRVDKTFVWDTWRLAVYLDIINVYDSENVESSFYSYDYTETRTVTGLPFFPTLGITARW